MQEDIVWSAFRVFDLDGNGQISREELAQVLSGDAVKDVEAALHVNREEIEKILSEVDEDGDGQIDQWSDWEDARETYSAIPGFAKQVDRRPAKLSFSDLPAGKGFQIEVKLVSLEGQEVLPKLDQLIATFE